MRLIAFVPVAAGGSGPGRGAGDAVPHTRPGFSVVLAEPFSLVPTAVQAMLAA